MTNKGPIITPPYPEVHSKEDIEVLIAYFRKVGRLSGHRLYIRRPAWKGYWDQIKLFICDYCRRYGEVSGSIMAFCPRCRRDAFGPIMTEYYSCTIRDRMAELKAVLGERSE